MTTTRLDQATFEAIAEMFEKRGWEVAPRLIREMAKKQPEPPATSLDPAMCEAIAVRLDSLAEAWKKYPEEYKLRRKAATLVRGEARHEAREQQPPEPPATLSAGAVATAAAIRAYHREHSAVLTESGLAAIIDRATGLPKLLAVNATMLAALELLDAEAAGDSPYLWQQVSEAVFAGRGVSDGQ